MQLLQRRIQIRLLSYRRFSKACFGVQQVSQGQLRSSYLSLNASTTGLNKPVTASASSTCIANSGLRPGSDCARPTGKIGRDPLNSGMRTNSDGYLTPSLDTGLSAGTTDYLEVLGGSANDISGIQMSSINGMQLHLVEESNSMWRHQSCIGL